MQRPAEAVREARGEPVIADSLTELRLGLRFDEGHPVLRIVGDIDLRTAPELDAVVGVLVGRPYDQIVLDLRDVSFMDAQGLNVIARSASQLVGARHLTIRAPNRATRRLLDMTDLGDRVRIDDPHPDDGYVDAVARSTRFAAGQDVVHAALLLVVALAEAAVEGADGVTVSLAPHGPLTGVVAVDPAYGDLDRDQYAVGQGPCRDAANHSEHFHMPVAADELRWPDFVPLARRRGINSIMSTPLRGSSGALGALNMYSLGENSFSDRDQETAELLARGAADLLDGSGPAPSDLALAGLVGDAVASRQTIAIAQGILIGNDHVSAADAYRTLRRESQRTGTPLGDLAATVVASAQGIGSDASLPS